MPRTIRASEGGMCYHVLNRGNARAEVFHKSGDYEAFLDTTAEAGLRVPMRVLAYCLMPNHFHLVVRPVADGDLSRWMGWLMTTHVRRYLTHYHHSGHVWQGRFKAFPIQDDGHLLAVLRYVERNPLRANMVAKAEEWPWSSLHPGASRRPLKVECPEPHPADWTERVNAAMSEAEEAAIRGVDPAGEAARLGLLGTPNGSASRPGLHPPPARPPSEGCRGRSRA